jgi:hypothetical protein
MPDKKNAIVQIFLPAKGWEQEAHLNWQNNEGNKFIYTIN